MTMPEKTSEMKQTLTLLSSEKYNLWTNSLNKIAINLPKKEEIKGLIKKQIELEEIQKTLSKWKTIFEQLPPDSNPENITTFKVPEFDKFNFSVLSSPDRIKPIFSMIKESKEHMSKVEEVCKKFRILPKTSHLNDIIKECEDLYKVLKNPQEPIGDPALISKKEKKTVVSIPLDVALKEPSYLKDIVPTPLIHSPDTLDPSQFK